MYEPIGHHPSPWLSVDLSWLTGGPEGSWFTQYLLLYHSQQSHLAFFSFAFVSFRVRLKQAFVCAVGAFITCRRKLKTCLTKITFLSYQGSEKVKLKVVVTFCTNKSLLLEAEVCEGPWEIWELLRSCTSLLPGRWMCPRRSQFSWRGGRTLGRRVRRSVPAVGTLGRGS